MAISSFVRHVPALRNAKVSSISVVTVCLNTRDTIRLTLESVARQTFGNVQHVVIDGASTDGTQDIVREYSPAYFVSERDAGVYHAMEKGAHAARGDVLIFLNAGDTFYDDDVCADVARFFDEAAADVVFGNLMPVRLNASDVHDHDAFQPGQLIDLRRISNRRHLYDESIHHQVTFYRRWIFDRCSYLCAAPEANGEYNVLLCAVMKENARVKHIPRPVTRFVLGGISTRNFAQEWAKYVRVRDTVRRLYCPEPGKIRIKGEREFHHLPPVRSRVPQVDKAVLKRAITRSVFFRAYARVALGVSTRTSNLLAERLAVLHDQQRAELQGVAGTVHRLEQHVEALRARKTGGVLDVNRMRALLERQTILLSAAADKRAEAVMARGAEASDRRFTALQAAVADSQAAAVRDIARMERDFVRQIETIRASVDQIKINVADVSTRVNSADDFAAHGFRVFSQWDEDGLLQYLVSRFGIDNKSFIEIGIGDYTECNTRLLLVKDNWRGLVIECNEGDVAKLRGSELHWRHTINVLNAFVDRENVNQLISENMPGKAVGVLSIDVDGVDYWLWDAIDVVSPDIVIVEYNGVFGATARVTVPYDPRFDRTAKHYSYLYAGASLGALQSLGERKGYALVGVNNGGNNAFFVRQDVLARAPMDLPAHPYRRPLFREARRPDGSLGYLSIEQGVDLIKDMSVYDVEKQVEVKIGDIPLSYE